MQRRTKALLLIFIGILIIGCALVWLYLSWKEVAVSTPQPPGYTDTPIQTEPLPSAPAPAAPVPTDPGLLESRRLEEVLRRQAQDFASRAGTYSNADEFAALREAGLQATPEVRTFFASERTRLTATYPLRSGTWGQTARGLASKITSPTPIRAQQQVIVQVDAQVITEVGDAAPAISYRQALITLQRTGASWLVSKIAWTEAP